MVFVLGFESPVIPAGLAEGRGQAHPEPDSSRVTAINEAEGLRADPGRADPSDSPATERPTRIAYTAKPDADGFPLQYVKGDDATAAEKIGFEIIVARRLSREDREVLLQDQEAQSGRDDIVRRLDELESADATTLALEQREQQDADRQRIVANQTGTTFDLQI